MRDTDSHLKYGDVSLCLLFSLVIGERQKQLFI